MAVDPRSCATIPRSKANIERFVEVRRALENDCHESGTERYSLIYKFGGQGLVRVKEAS